MTNGKKDLPPNLSGDHIGAYLINIIIFMNKMISFTPHKRGGEMGKKEKEKEKEKEKKKEKEKEKEKERKKKKEYIRGMRVINGKKDLPPNLSGDHIGAYLINIIMFMNKMISFTPHKRGGTKRKEERRKRKKRKKEERKKERKKERRKKERRKKGEGTEVYPGNESDKWQKRLTTQSIR